MFNIMKKDPFTGLTPAPERWNEMLNRVFSGFEGLGFEQPLTSADFLPPVDILEDEHNITLHAEIPGVKEEDLNIRSKTTF